LLPKRKTSGVWGQRPQGARAILRGEKSQLIHRVPLDQVQEVLRLFNAQEMDAATACERLQIGRARLYQLRTRWLQDKAAFNLKASGGNHKELWPEAVDQFIQEILPLSKPLNCAFISDQLERRFAFKRSRAAVAQYIEDHHPLSISLQPPGPKPRRRWQTAAIGELFQHDSSPHQWWPGAIKQTLILTADDHSRRIVAGRFDADTTWDHFRLLRDCFQTHGQPAAFYTDGLSLFGHTSSSDEQDPLSQFQRALGALGINHRVAPSPQAKGKIERLFGTLQKRLVTLFAYEKVASHSHANELLQKEIAHYNQSHRHSEIGQTPNEAWEKALAEGRSKLKPAAEEKLLNLHLALHLGRRVSSANTIEFLGKTWKIAPTAYKRVLIVHHPQKHFWVTAPARGFKVWPDVLASYDL
jgi:transposase InsO family protein